MDAECEAEGLENVTTVSRIATAIGEPARARILFCLMDHRARTSTELAVAGGVSPSTASVHLNRLKDERLVSVQAQGKHRYYSLQNSKVARVLESLSVLAGYDRREFVPDTPNRLRAARTCYDHIAGTLGVLLYHRLTERGWLSPGAGSSYELTPVGARALQAMKIDVQAAQRLRRRFAYPCLDWSERRPHVGGALGSALLMFTLQQKWIAQDLDSRALTITSLGRREWMARFGIQV